MGGIRVPYREKKIYSGRILEVEIYPITLQERKQSRRQKEKISSKQTAPTAMPGRF